MRQAYPPPVESVAYLNFPNLEKMVATMTTPAIFANDIDTSTIDGAEYLKTLLYTRYQGDVLSATPKCNCGNLSGGYYKGVTCEVCHSTCEDVLNKPLESTVWIRVPDGIHRFIAPGFWIVASRALTRSGFNLLEYLVDSRYEVPNPKNPFYSIVEMLDIKKSQRNLNYFYTNFDTIMKRVITYMIIRKKPKQVDMTPEQIQLAYNTMRNDHTAGPYILMTTPLGKKYDFEKALAKFILKYINEKDRVFTRYLPLPSAQGLILESGSAGTYTETQLWSSIDAMYAITQIPLTLGEQKLPLKNRRSVLCTKKMAEFSKDYLKDNAGGKEGTFRRHINGGRIPFSMRCVISSINEPHANDELWLPWSPSVQFFKCDITNKLYRRGFTPRQATEFIENHTNVYHPMLDEIFQELIRESGNGVPMTFQRSPSLEKGSIQLCRGTRVKTDIEDLTISMSINISISPNADGSIMC